MSGNLDAFWSTMQHLFLPSTALALAIFGPILRMTRSSLIEAKHFPHIVTELSKGFSQRQVMWRHVMPLATPSVLTVVAAVLSFAVGGVVLVEVVFSWPGLGTYAYNAMLSADYPAVQGFVLVTTLAHAVIYLAVDIAIAWIDPRVRLDGSE